MSTGSAFRITSTGLSERSLHPIIDERHEFAIKSYRVSQKTIGEVLTGAQHTAGHLKKSLTSQPTTSTRAYATLHRAYSLQVQDVINLKAIIAIANSVGWKEVVATCKKFLRQLPLTPHNLATTAEMLYKTHGGPEKEPATEEASEEPQADTEPVADGPPLIVVGTTSELKLNAVTNVAAKLFPEAEITGTKASSGVAEQPFGHEETLQGARNRAMGALEMCAEAEVAIGIENGIVECNGITTDLAWVVALTRSGTEGVAQSAGIVFPQKFVEKARAQGFDKVTVGSLIAEATGCDSADPHAYLSNGLQTRQQLLEPALQMALVAALQ